MSVKICTECETKYEDAGSSNPGHCPNCNSMYWALATMEVAQSISPKKNRIGDIRSDLSIYTPRKNEQNTEQVAEVSDTEKLIAAQNKKTQELIAAQNKTTHAVRSLAITFVAAPVITFAVLIVIALSVSTGNITFIILTAISAIIICVYVLIAALTELGKSKVD
jgi:hypothetical protein